MHIFYRLDADFAMMPLTPILKKRQSIMNSSSKRVLFSTREPARSVILKYRETGNSSHFDKIFEDLATSGTTVDLLSWLNQMTDCVTLLDRQADKLVLEFLEIPWFRPKLMEVAVAAEDFFTTLVSAHNYYAYLVLKHLFTLLIPEVNESDPTLLEKAGLLSAEEEECYRHILSTIVAVQDHVPLIRDNLVALARKSFPYFTKHVHQHAVYTRNLLLLARCLPHLRISLLEIIINNLATLDVYTPRSELVPVEEDEEEEEEEDGSDDEEVFPMELEESKDKEVETANDSPSITKELAHILNHKNGNTLDVLMCIMFQYVHDVCHGSDVSGKPTELSKKCFHYKFPPDPLQNEPEMCQAGSVSLSGGNTIAGCKCRGSKHNLDALKLLYTELKEVFSRTILIVEASSYIQFLMFYLLALRPGLATYFLEFLRTKKFEDPNCSRDVRQNAMAYIGSLLARGKFIPFDVVHSCLEIICTWCNTYLDNQESNWASNYEGSQLHTPFYYACQTIFYVFTFRHREYTENSQRLVKARSLNLERLVMSQLNPLRVCASPVVSNFASVTRHFQLAYCYTVMENNKRLRGPSARWDGGKFIGNSTLDMFFPFDPYLLHRSKVYISDHYREFDGLPEVVTSKTQRDEDSDMIISPKLIDFSYGSSPGYKRCHNDSFSWTIL
ncbi:RNA polymerase I-specific transcription initiation factor RRN3 [Procambarus clarkii]|uniref:RNA polymerase I-specific transcription initiation factor RRN3 n=1 Tax=Procambarus clarkii TaxID=6728 RepID=UPI0037424FE5